MIGCSSEHLRIVAPLSAPPIWSRS